MWSSRLHPVNGSLTTGDLLGPKANPELRRTSLPTQWSSERPATFDRRNCADSCRRPLFSARRSFVKVAISLKAEECAERIAEQCKHHLKFGNDEDPRQRDGTTPPRSTPWLRGPEGKVYDTLSHTDSQGCGGTIRRSCPVDDVAARQLRHEARRERLAFLGQD